jgi:protein SCO1/2
LIFWVKQVKLPQPILERLYLKNQTYRFTRLFLGILFLWFLGGCNPSFRSVDISQSKSFGTNFSLEDGDGNVKTITDYRGKLVVLFFGYTHCPDVCPTTLIKMNDVLALLGADANRVQVIFVTVDPERDTGEVLKRYVPAFNPGFVGLRPANDVVLKQLAKDFKIYYQRVPGSTPAFYTMDHTAGEYIFDTDGKLRLFARYDQSPESLAHDLKELLH